MRRLGLVALSLVMAVLLGAGCRPRQLEEQQARDLLAAIRNARQETSVRGTLTTTIRMGNETVTAEAEVHRGGGRMRLEFITGLGKGAKIISQGHRVWQISPDGNTVRRLPFNPIDVGPPLSKRGAVQVQPGGTVAGRVTDKVTVRPSPSSATRMEMFVDRQTRFPMATTRYNDAGELVSGTRYVTADFSVGPPEPVTPDQIAAWDEKSPIGGKIDRQRAETVLGIEPLEPGYVPEGFVKVGYFLHQRHRTQAVELRYSDGVRSLSVVEFRTAQPRGDGPGGNARGRDAEAREPGPSESGQQSTRAGLGNREQPAGPPLAVVEHWQKLTPEQRRERQREWREMTPRQRRETADRIARQRGVSRETPPREGGAPDGVGRAPGRASGESRAYRGRDSETGRSRLRGRVVRFRVGELTIVIAGEAPGEELRKMADSINETSAEF